MRVPVLPGVISVFDPMNEKMLIEWMNLDSSS